MAAQAIGSLYAQLGLDSAQFDTGIAKARGKLSDFGKTNFSSALKAGLGEIDGALKSTAGQAGALGNILGGLGITGAAAGAAIAVAFTGARSAMAFGDEIADTANKLRVTTDYLQEMRFAAHQLGGDFTDADAALEGFTKTFGLAKSGLSAKAVKPFEALGLDPKSFETVQQALDAVIDKISGLGDVAEQAAVADKLGLTPLLPAIREGAGAIDDLRKAAHDLGYVMDDSLIEKAGDANDQFEALQAILNVQFKSAMVDAIPLVMQLTQWMADGAKAAGEFAKGVKDISDKFAYLSTHDLRGNAVKNDRDKLFGPSALAQRVRQIAAPADPIGKGGVSMASLQAMFGAPEPAAPTGNLIDLEDKTRRQAEAQRKAAEAERERVAALKALADAMHEAEQRSADYAAGLLDDIATMGMSSEQTRRYQIAQQAAAAPTAALAGLITSLGVKYQEQAKVGREAANVQKEVKDQQSETITTIHDAVGPTIDLTTRTEALAMEMADMARRALEVRWGIQDIADAINDNDWTSALAGFTRVMAQVEKAFDKNADAAKRYAAIAGIAMGVGNVVGGTGGAVLSGAGSGAMAGLGLASSLTTLGIGIPGPGWALAAGGAVLGALGGIFGSSKAKKQAKRQAAAQAAAAEAQRQQQIADAKYSIDLALLQAQGKETEALALQRQHELDALAKLDPSLVDLQKQLYGAQDAADAAAKAAERQAQADSRRASIQDQIDKLTMSDSELLAKTRAKERAEAVALDPALGDLIDKLYGLQDSAAVSEKATEALSAANDAAAEAAQRQAEALAQTAEVMNGFASASQRIDEALKDTMRSLTDFADSLKAELGLSTTGGALDQARKAFNAAVASGNFAAIPQLGQAYAEAAKSSGASGAEYRQILAQIRLASLNSVTAAKSDAYQQQLSNQLFGELYRGNFDAIDQIRALRAAGLPGFATGGEFTIGGAPGVDQNLVSVNGVPAAWVSRGEIMGVKKGSANDNGPGAAELIAEMRIMNARLAKIERSTGDTRDLLDQVSEGGNALRTEAAS